MIKTFAKLCNSFLSKLNNILIRKILSETRSDTRQELISRLAKKANPCSILVMNFRGCFNHSKFRPAYTKVEKPDRRVSKTFVDIPSLFDIRIRFTGTD